MLTPPPCPFPSPLDSLLLLLATLSPSCSSTHETVSALLFSLAASTNKLGCGRCENRNRSGSVDGVSSDPPHEGGIIITPAAGCAAPDPGDTVANSPSGSRTTCESRNACVLK